MNEIFTKVLTVLCLTVLMSFPIVAQYYSGQVLSRLDSLPIPYAIISDLEGKTGAYADSIGVFEFDLAKKADSIIFGALGFESDTIESNELKRAKIYLTPYSYNLQIAKISSKRLSLKNKRFGKIKGSKKGISIQKGGVVVKYFNTDNEGGKINKIRYGLFKNFSPECNGLIRPRIFQAKIEGDTILPGPEIYTHSKPILVSPKRSLLEIGLLDYDVRFSEEGFFAGLEFLGENPSCANYKDDGFGKSISIYDDSVQTLVLAKSYLGNWFRFRISKESNLSMEVKTSVYTEN